MPLTNVTCTGGAGQAAYELKNRAVRFENGPPGFCGASERLFPCCAYSLLNKRSDIRLNIISFSWRIRIRER